MGAAEAERNRIYAYQKTEKTCMIIRLRNLALRIPTMTDVAAVTRLINTCDRADDGVADETEQRLRAAWHVPTFHLEQDSWVVVTCSGDMVGYGVVRRDEGQLLTFSMYVHPDYRGRGIGTLLLWLLEERARQLARCDCGDESNAQVVLRTTIINTCAVARHLFEREGYSKERSFWRLTVEMEPDYKVMRDGKMMVELTLDASTLVAQKSTDMYTAHQYIVYTKVLQTGRKIDPVECEELCLPTSTG
jgi:GNAT superfamily N-acetyltransferase